MTANENIELTARNKAIAVELVKRVREIAPLLAKNAAPGEQDRRVAQESFEADEGRRIVQGATAQTVWRTRGPYAHDHVRFGSCGRG